MNRPLIFRILSLVLLSSYLQILLPPAAALGGPSGPLPEPASPARPAPAREQIPAVPSEILYYPGPAATEALLEKGPLPAPVMTCAEAGSASAGDAEAASDPKPWYKKWWVWGIGAAVVTGTVLLLAGGDDEEAAPDQPLPGFPDPPAAAYRMSIPVR